MRLVVCVRAPEAERVLQQRPLPRGSVCKGARLCRQQRALVRCRAPGMKGTTQHVALGAAGGEVCSPAHTLGPQDGSMPGSQRLRKRNTYI